MSTQLPQTITITPIERDMTIEALAACIAFAAYDFSEAGHRQDSFTALLMVHKRECRNLLAKLLAIS